MTIVKICYPTPSGWYLNSIMVYKSLVLHANLDRSRHISKYLVLHFFTQITYVSFSKYLESVACFAEDMPSHNMLKMNMTS